MRLVDLLAGIAAVLMSAPALASSDLTCRDSNAMASARSMDGFYLSMFADAARDAFRNADAERAGNGLPTFTQDWNTNRMVGEVIAVVMSCQKHPADSIDRRSAAVFNEYAVLHSQ